MSETPAALPRPTHSAPHWINAVTRRAALAALPQTADDPVDLLVIGGGITGTGVALDAAARGLRVVLVERRDLGSGTSGYSSKLIHGGLRYLAKGDVSIARESAIERHHLMTTIAPHIVQPCQTVIPLTEHVSRRDAALTATGLRLADVLRRSCRTPSRLLPGPSKISAHEVALLAPGTTTVGLRGGLTYWDGQVEDDVRLVVNVARTAAAQGAAIITRAAASEVNARSATITDELTGDTYTVHARAVVNATGIWASDIAPQLKTSPSRGTHLVVRSEAVGEPRAILTIPVPGAFGRYAMVIPQPDGVCYIGLTDEPAPGEDPYAPTVPDSDREFLLTTVNTVLATRLTTDDIIGQYAGLRPLVSDGSDGSTADISRKHLLVDEPGRPITITGGKLTTYRRMAEEAVDAVVQRLGIDRPCVTTGLPLVGAADRATLRTVEAPSRLVRRFGSEAPAIAALADSDPALLSPVAVGSPVLGVEVIHAVLAEGALTVDDFLDRRVRSAFSDTEREAMRWECTKLFDRTVESLATAG